MKAKHNEKKMWTQDKEEKLVELRARAQFMLSVYFLPVYFLL